ncbi:HSP20 family protein [Mariniflexile fucanivorans]|uniref:HSP20 family protein n=1 Tax=Mariniflexile fucanivorans TaxID=264023 RepID=A0A4R1RI25_9FLAO|nr:Hsp20/alpha crystallin family protein [Mariniflexile fucanivorans]TCL65599.1 HSP20 family protein [Mariniflexile fucanivorans]
MKTLMKRRKRNKLSPFNNSLMTPWNNSFLRPWAGDFFNSNFDNMALGRFDDIFRNDFFENDSLMPAMNVQEHKEGFEIELAAPGFDKKDFEVTIEEDVLHVFGEKEIEEEEKEDDFSHKEFSYKSFKRSMMLPPSVDLNQEIKATYKNGILKLKLLKKQETIEKAAPPKKVIEVN